MKNLLLVTIATLGLTAATMAQNLPNYIPANGLVGWYPFNGNANDESGNGNDGTVNGATPTIDRFGNQERAFSFDGNDNIVAPPVQANSEISVSFWTNNITVDQGGHIITQTTESPSGTLVYWAFDYLANTPNHGSKAGSYKGLYNSSCLTNVDNEIWHNTLAVANWNHITFTISDSGRISSYLNGDLVQSALYLPLSNCPIDSNAVLRFGGPWLVTGPLFFHGTLDDIAIWNRALSEDEVAELYNAVGCDNLIIDPVVTSAQTGGSVSITATTSDPNPVYQWQSDLGQGFQTLSDFGNYSGTNSVTLNITNVQLANHNQPIRAITTSGNCIDTSNVSIISITDTCINTLTDTTLITVTDTLIINSTITALNPPNNANTIKVFPNPTNDHITIDYGNFSIMNGYQLKIENSLGQEVFQTDITQQSDYLNLSTWGGNGLYFVHIIDPQGNTIDIRKILLQ